MAYTRNFVIVFALSFLFVGQCMASIVFSAPPRESVDAGKKVYGPIAKKLSKLLGTPVTYKHPNNWTNYSNEMREGNYDIVFDGPHFASWRMKHGGHVPVARLSGHLQFYVLAKRNDAQLTNLRELLGKPFCGLATPNLATISVFDMYNNPVIQPNMHIVKGGMKKVMKMFLDGRCRAAVVRDKLYKKLSDEQKLTINIIGKSGKMPNQSFTVRSDLKQLSMISEFFNSKEGIQAAENLLNRFSRKKKFFVRTSFEEFNDLNDLLEGVVYGWAVRT